MKLVSIVIPTYKRPDMICRAIESALTQSYSDVEVIVVDDNNPETEERQKTERAMKKFIDTPNVHYIRHERNKNGSAARNTGWRASHGDYVTFLDDDDEIAPTKIERQVARLEELDDSWGACYSAYHVLRPNGKRINSATTREGDVYIQALMRTLYLGSGSNLLLRRSVLEAVDGYDETFLRNQDVEFMARVAERFKVAYVPEDLMTVHWEVRQFKRGFAFVDQVALNYLERFRPRLMKLSEKDQRCITIVVSLERARVALAYGELHACITILRLNKVPLWHTLKYIGYLLKRKLTNTSYGFYIHDGL